MMYGLQLLFLRHAQNRTPVYLRRDWDIVQWSYTVRYHDYSSVVHVKSVVLTALSRKTGNSTLRGNVGQTYSTVRRATEEKRAEMENGLPPCAGQVEKIQ